MKIRGKTADFEVFVTFFRHVCVATLVLASGCSAQQPAPAPPDPALNRRIETRIRSHYTNIPSTVAVKIGERRASEYPGFDTITITLEQGDRKSSLDFLISQDNTRLARPEKIDVDALLFSADRKSAVRIDPLDIATLPASDADLSGRPVRGHPEAKVTILNYDDFQCPYCQEMHIRLVHEVLPRYGDRVRVIYKDYPLTNIHPWAVHAAVNANCLAAQDPAAYWEFADHVHDRLAEINKNAKGEKRALVEQTGMLDAIARQIGRQKGLDAARLDACVQKQDDSAVRASMAEGDRFGVDSTPTLFINGERITGAMPTGHVEAVLDRALTAAGVPVPDAPASAAAPAARKPPTSGTPDKE
jgi:protein-disulfide isomerase